MSSSGSGKALRLTTDPIRDLVQPQAQFIYSSLLQAMQLVWVLNLSADTVIGLIERSSSKQPHTKKKFFKIITLRLNQSSRPSMLFSLRHMKLVCFGALLMVEQKSHFMKATCMLCSFNITGFFLFSLCCHAVKEEIIGCHWGFGGSGTSALGTQCETFSECHCRRGK